MKLGVITDGISRDFEHALEVMTEARLRYAELQFVWDREVGDHSPEQVERIKGLVNKHQVKVSCVSRHIFAGLPILLTQPEDEIYQSHLLGLKRCINLAKSLEAPLVRIMSGRKEMILFGYNGAEDWVVSTGAWSQLLKLMEPPVRIAEEEKITLVIETGNNAMTSSGILARKLIDELGTHNLKILWDIPNTQYCTEIPYPDAYEEIKDYIGHIHIKGVKADIARSTVRFCPLEEGDIAPYLEEIVNALKRNEYQGTISYESVYRPDNGTYEDGFRTCFPTFKRIFGT